jgi:hypothetical protein
MAMYSERKPVQFSNHGPPARGGGTMVPSFPLRGTQLAGTMSPLGTQVLILIECLGFIKGFGDNIP